MNLSSFTHLHVVPNMKDFLYSVAQLLTFVNVVCAFFQNVLAESKFGTRGSVNDAHLFVGLNKIIQIPGFQSGFRLKLIHQNKNAMHKITMLHHLLFVAGAVSQSDGE